MSQLRLAGKGNYMRNDIASIGENPLGTDTRFKAFSMDAVPG